MAPVRWLIKAPCSLSLSTYALTLPATNCSPRSGGLREREREGGHRAPKDWRDYLITYIALYLLNKPHSQIRSSKLWKHTLFHDSQALQQGHCIKGGAGPFFLLANYCFIRFLQHLIELGTSSVIYK